ncbi:MAG TPA: nuclear transport factor 2 family protein [Actinomycetota bacterium]|nr:nuclear transport factor 2 family protein [Actinomycetota bacterium]
MDRRSFGAWLARYFGAWASNDAEEVAALFADEAEYSWGPFREPARGRDAIVRAWVDGGSPPGFRWQVEPIAVSGNVGVAHWSVSFDDGRAVIELDGVLVCEFDTEGRCIRHREWYDRSETR